MRPVARAVLLLIAGLGMAGAGVYSLVMEYVFHLGASRTFECSDWLDSPDVRWLELRGCTLDTSQIILESDLGDMEALETRVEGLSTHIYERPPRWVAAWVPIRDDADRSNLVRAAYRIESTDVLKFINTLDQAPASKRAEMWADPVPLRRIVKPGVLIGRSEKSTNDALLRAWGSMATPSLLIVIAGEAPESKAGLVGILSLVLGATLVFIGARLFANASGGPLGGSSASHTITSVNVSDVKMEIGGLEELRAEERAARRSQADDDR